VARSSSKDQRHGGQAPGAARLHPGQAMAQGGIPRFHTQGEGQVVQGEFMRTEQPARAGEPEQTPVRRIQQCGRIAEETSTAGAEQHIADEGQLGLRPILHIRDMNGLVPRGGPDLKAGSAPLHHRPFAPPRHPRGGRAGRRVQPRGPGWPAAIPAHRPHDRNGGGSARYGTGAGDAREETPARVQPRPDPPPRPDRPGRARRHSCHSSMGTRCTTRCWNGKDQSGSSRCWIKIRHRNR
jgi:hypothetical protein